MKKLKRIIGVDINIYAEFNVQNICLNNFLAYLQFNFENVHR
jgi:hypothetical protein